MRLGIRLLLVASVTVLLLELGVRALDLGPRTYRDRSVEPYGYSPFGRTASGLLVYRPDARWDFLYDPAGDPRGYFGPEGRLSFRINSLGLRGPERDLAKPQGTTRIMCLGDSFTFGEGVRLEDAYPAQLERELLERQPDRAVEVWNAGVQAYGTFEAVELLSRHLLAARPDIVALGFFLNDATSFETTVAQFEERTKSRPVSTLARASRLVGILERSRAARHRREAFVAATRASFAGPGWERCQQALTLLAELSRDQEFRLVVAVFPVLEDLSSDYPFEPEHRRITGFLEELDIEHIDLLETYRGHDSSSLWVHATDPHPNDVAHALAAERLADVLQPR